MNTPIPLLRIRNSLQTMDDLADFEYVFGSNPNLAYDEEIRRKILQNRRILDNELFIDRLLKALGITKGRPSN